MFFTVKELAARWKVSVATVKRWIRQGQLRAVRLGPRLRRVPREEVERWESENERD